MLQAKPGAFARLGQGGAERGCFLHSSRYDFNDSVIPLGAGLPRDRFAERAMPVTAADAAQCSTSRRRSPPITPRHATKFLQAARARSLPVERHVHPTARGANGEDARRPTSPLLGDPGAARAAGADVGDARRRRILRLGLPGRAAARRHGPCDGVVDSGVAVVLYHAVNPYGFSHLRRTNEDNVDVNRNFRDFRAAERAQRRLCERACDRSSRKSGRRPAPTAAALAA